MLLVSTLLYLGTLTATSPCPPAFQTLNTTVGALTNSTEMLICLRKAVLTPASDGSLTLVINSNKPAPECLIYPNGVSPDFAAELINSGHTGCWSLYPPSQKIAVTNVGSPPKRIINLALARFRPTVPRIYLTPKKGFLVGNPIRFTNSAKLETQKCRMLSLNCEVRFTPKTFRWLVNFESGRSASHVFLPKVEGKVLANLSVSFTVQYRFLGLTNWRAVSPNVTATASPVTLIVGVVPKPPATHSPRLVDQLCSARPRWGC